MLVGKSCAAPIKYVSIPRLDMTAATPSVKMSKMLKDDFNDVKRFKVFEDNCVQLIRDHMHVKQWHYVNIVDNPADYVSRGLDISQNEDVYKWLKLLRIMGFIIIFIKNLKVKSGKGDISVKSTAIPVDLLKDAECKILKIVQELTFGKEIEILKSNATSEIRKCSNITLSDMLIDNEEL